MRMLLTAAAALAALAAAPSLAADPPTAQIKRGQDLFMNSPKGTACGTCHEMAGLGTAVGPSLKNIAAYAMPRGIVIAIRMSSTETVQLVTPNSAARPFPARIVEKQNGIYKFWNLSENPPALISLNEKEVSSLTRDQKWKHPPAAAGYSNAELADIIGFLKWAANGSQKPITEDEVESSR